MSYPVTVRSDAQHDISVIAHFYERQQPGIGNYFLLCLDAAVETVKRSPLAFRKAHGEYRRILIHRFPVGIFYLIHEDRIIVAAVIDLRRNPASIKERLQG